LIRKAVRRLLEEEGVKGKKEISIAIVDVHTMRDLQMRYKGVDYPTDVLAFPIGGRVFGDVIVCADVAEEQGREYGTGFLKEVIILVLHGVLHLLGYEDSTKEGAELMLSKATDIADKVMGDGKEKAS
jgi:probable rRNA maturation factor